MGLTRTAITRPVFILMLVLMAFLMGTISYKSMRVELNPEVSFGVVTVQTQYPGANPDTINTQVSRKIEEAVSGVNGIREVTSTSQTGTSSVVVQLEHGVNTDVAPVFGVLAGIGQQVGEDLGQAFRIGMHLQALRRHVQGEAMLALFQ